MLEHLVGMVEAEECGVPDVGGLQEGIRSEFKDYLEKKDACAKLKCTKQTNTVCEYISLIQSLNIDARYDEEFL